jgi:hypothetical protein
MPTTFETGQWPPVLRNDPVIQQIVSGLRPGVGGANMPQAAAANQRIQARAAQLGYQPPAGMVLDVGGVHTPEKFNPYLPLAAAGFVGGPALISALASGGGAAGAGSAASAGATAPTAAGAASGAGAGAGAATTAASTGGILGTVSKVLPIFKAGSDILGAISNERSQNQAAQNALAQTGYDDALKGYNAGIVGSEADLSQRRYLDDLYTQKSKQAVKGSFLTGVQDANVTAPAGVPRGNITGGLRPSAIPDRAAIGDAMKRQAMLELLNPTQPGSTPVSQRTPDGSYLPSLPTVPTAPTFQSGGGSALDYLSLGLAAPSFIQQMLSDYRQRTPAPMPPRVTAPSVTGTMPPVSFAQPNLGSFYNLPGMNGVRF